MTKKQKDIDMKVVKELQDRLDFYFLSIDPQPLERGKDTLNIFFF